MNLTTLIIAIGIQILNCLCWIIYLKNKYANSGEIVQ